RRRSRPSQSTCGTGPPAAPTHASCASSGPRTDGMTVIDTDAREARASALETKNINGFDFVLVSLAGQTAAPLEVHFLNANRLPQLLAAAAPAKTLFPISGGQRVRAGAASGEVQVTGTFVQVTGSLPISPAGLSVAETLTIAVGNQSVSVALPSGT